jgi:hypothetical protein
MLHTSKILLVKIKKLLEFYLVKIIQKLNKNSSLYSQRNNTMLVRSDTQLLQHGLNQYQLRLVKD